MSLLDQAAVDLRTILEDSVGGFATTITLTDPSGVSAVLKGRANDISRSIDPQTGMVVSGRVATVTLALAAIAQAGLDVPRGVADDASKPWLVSFNDVLGNSHTLKISSTDPDRTLPLVICTLEAYQP